jgi:hypothetical protein
MDGGISTYWTVNKVADYKPGLDEEIWNSW